MGYLVRKRMLVGEARVKGKANVPKGKRSPFDVGNPCRFLQGHRASFVHAFCSTVLHFSLSLQVKIVPRSLFIFPRALTSFQMTHSLLFLLLMSEMSTRIPAPQRVKTLCLYAYYLDKA